MRVSLRNQYSNFLYNLQDTQSRLMDLNMQASRDESTSFPPGTNNSTSVPVAELEATCPLDQFTPPSIL